jgi:hypothetical protein
MQLMPEPILSKYMPARNGKRDVSSYPFASGQEAPVRGIFREDSLIKEHKGYEVRL